MPPKKKQPVPKTADIAALEEEVKKVVNVTARRRKPKDQVNLEEQNEKLILEKNVNTSITDEKMMTDVLHKVKKSETEVLPVEDENENDIELSEKPVKKKVTKAKPKAKQTNAKTKQIIEDFQAIKIRKRSLSSNREVTPVTSEKETVVVRKRPNKKEPISPLNDPPKRGRRAQSVDTISSKISLQTLDVPKKGRKAIKVIPSYDEEKLKKNRVVVKEDEKMLENNVKKNKKKIATDEKKNSSEENLDELSDVPKKRKPKRGAKKEQIIELSDGFEQNSDNEYVQKMKENEKKDLKIKQKRIHKVKDLKNNLNNDESKQKEKKRVYRGKKIEIEQNNEDKGKESIAKDPEEKIKQKSPEYDEEEKETSFTGFSPDSSPGSPPISKVKEKKTTEVKGKKPKVKNTVKK